MRWDDEPYVRLYRRETPEWCLLSWQARALFHELLKRVDMAGLLMVGKSGLRGLAGLVRMPLEVVRDAMHGEDGLLADGCVLEVEGGYLIPNYVEAQQAKQSDRVRKAEQRARDRAAKLDEANAKAAESRDVTGSHALSAESHEPEADGHSVTNRDIESRSVTECHAQSRGVTAGHTESLLAELSEAKLRSSILKGPSPQLPPETRAPARAGGGGGRVAIPGFGSDPELTPDAVIDELRRHPQLNHVVTGATHAPKTLAELARSNGVTLAQLVECVGYVASITPDGEAVSATLGRLRGAVMKVHKRAVDQRRRDREEARESATEPAPRPKLPPGTGRLPPPMPLPERVVQPRFPVATTQAGQGAPSATQSDHADAGNPPTPGRAHSVAATAIGDLLANMPRPSGEP